jgi:hypothetical protein
VLPYGGKGPFPNDDHAINLSINGSRTIEAVEKSGARVGTTYTSSMTPRRRPVTSGPGPAISSWEETIPTSPCRHTVDTSFKRSGILLLSVMSCTVNLAGHRSKSVDDGHVEQRRPRRATSFCNDGFVCAAGSDNTRGQCVSHAAMLVL